MSKSASRRKPLTVPVCVRLCLCCFFGVHCVCVVFCLCLIHLVVCLCSIPKEDPLPGIGATCALTLGVCSVAASLRCVYRRTFCVGAHTFCVCSIFGNERTIFWRESSVGVSTLAYFLGKNIAHMVNLACAPACFMLLFYQVRFALFCCPTHTHTHTACDTVLGVHQLVFHQLLVLLDRGCLRLSGLDCCSAFAGLR